jgi:hypothetical protein
MATSSLRDGLGANLNCAAAVLIVPFDPALNQIYPRPDQLLLETVAHIGEAVDRRRLGGRAAINALLL